MDMTTITYVQLEASRIHWENAYRDGKISYAAYMEIFNAYNAFYADLNNQTNLNTYNAKLAQYSFHTLGGGGGEGGGGCFIATACYGSPTHTRVNQLRQIKNRLVAKSKIASVAYRLYYVFSPSVAQKIRNMPHIKRLIRGIIEALT